MSGAEVECTNCGVKFAVPSDVKVVSLDEPLPVVENALAVGDTERVRESWFRKSIGTLGGVALWTVAVAVPVLLLIFGMRIAQTVYPWVVLISAGVLIVAVPSAAVCAFIPRARGYSVSAFYVASVPLFVAQWIACFMYAFSVSQFWCMASILYFGVGVIPLSFVELVWHREWHGLMMLVITLVICVALRATARFVASIGKAPEVDPIAIALRDAFMAASDACDAAFLAVDPYTTRASYLLEMPKAERERERYKRPLYSEEYLDAHTVAIGTVTSAFDALTASFAALSSGDSLYPTLVGIYEGTSAICRLTAKACHYAALCAAVDAANSHVQALKDGVDATMLEASAA